jgi:Forkhead domain
MCSNAGENSSFIGTGLNPHGLMPTATSASTPGLLPIDHYRLQLYNYAMVERLRCSQYTGSMGPMCPTYQLVGSYGPRMALSMSHRVFQPEEPKPQHRHIGLIAMAILSNIDSKLVLSDIYQHILDIYSYFRSREPDWRSSIRYNLSINDCFVKAGLSAHGKKHYWAIHPANLEDFKKGDFRRRKAQRKVRKHMGLAVDDDGADSPSPSPLSLSPGGINPLALCPSAWTTMTSATTAVGIYAQSRKRQFDVASLLAPDEDSLKFQSSAKRMFQSHHSYSQKLLHHTLASSTSDIELEEDIDVVASDQEDDKNIAITDRESATDGLSPASQDEDVNYMSPTKIETPIEGRNQNYDSNLISFENYQQMQQHQQIPSHFPLHSLARHQSFHHLAQQQHHNQSATSWQGLMQNWSNGIGIDPCQYMAAAQVSRRFTNLSSSSPADDIDSTNLAATATLSVPMSHHHQHLKKNVGQYPFYEY